MSQDVTLSMPAPWFGDFSRAIAKFNKRTEKANAGLKKAKYQKVTRFPVMAKVRTPGNPTDTVTVCVAIKDRSKVLWQELVTILDHYRDHCFNLEGKRVATPEGQAAHYPATVPAKTVSSPVQPVFRQWGLWVPCESEAAARAAAGFLAAIAKVGQPQVECRG
jgi:hypothetical protein